MIKAPNSHPSLSAERKSPSNTLGLFWFPYVRMTMRRGSNPTRGFDRQLICQD